MLNDDLRRLIRALSTEQTLNELEEAKKSSKKVYETLTSLDLQAEINSLEEALQSAGFVKNDLGQACLQGVKYLRNSSELFLKLHTLVREKIKSYKQPAEESETTPKEESGERADEKVSPKDVAEEAVEEIVQEE